MNFSTFIVLLILIEFVVCDTLNFVLDEQLPVGTEVGYVGDDVPEVTAELTYDIFPISEHSHLFRIDGATMRTDRIIDRELLCPKRTSCELNVSVRTRPMFKIRRVFVRLVDSNDFRPKFELDHVTMEILETTPIGSEFSLDIAVDNDSPAYGVQEYTLDGGNNNFRLEKILDNRGHVIELFLVTLVDLDRETEATYELTILADDFLNPPATQTIAVIVRDVNDNRPKFSRRVYEAEVDERSLIGEHVTVISASDADSGEFGNIRYSLIFSDDVIAGEAEAAPFSVNATSGEVKVNAPLDRENVARYSIAVQASDPNSETRAKLLISVRDYNDNPPRITARYEEEDGSAHVAENQDAGSYVIHFSVEDPDVGDNARVDCELKSGAQSFTLIELFEGEYKIITNSELDREQTDVYVVNVVCTDSGSNQLSSSKVINIKVDDVNDNAPIFNNDHISISVLENSKEGIELCRLVASDADTGYNGDVRYVISGKESKTFSIDPLTGSITSRRSLDREHDDYYVIKVTASDQGHGNRRSTIASVLVSVLDTDDQLPEFDEERYTLEPYESVRTGSSIGSVRATDDDLYPYNEFTYRLIPDHNTTFEIDGASGSITLLKPLDIEEVPTYQLTVQALSPNGLGASVRVVVRVKDVNEHAPRWLDPLASSMSRVNATITIDVLTPTGSKVIRFKAVDDDPSSTVTYSLHGPHHVTLFNLDLLTGILMLEERLTVDVVYLFSVVANDQDGRNTTMDVTVIAKHTAVPLSSSMNIVIVVACISGVLAVMLTIVIIAVLRQKKYIYTKNLCNSLPCYCLNNEDSVSDTSTSITVVRNMESRREVNSDKKCPAYTPCPSYTMAMRARSSGQDSNSSSEMKSVTPSSRSSPPSAVRFTDSPAFTSSPIQSLSKREDDRIRISANSLYYRSTHVYNNGASIPASSSSKPDLNSISSEIRV